MPGAEEPYCFHWYKEIVCEALPKIPQQLKIN
jgi:hypothetical protein